MTAKVISIAEWERARRFEPRYVAFRCTCLRCGSNFVLHAPEDTAQILFLDQAVTFHRKYSTTCSAFDMKFVSVTLPEDPPEEVC